MKLMCLYIELLPEKGRKATKFFVGYLGVQGIITILFLLPFLAQLKQWWIQKDFDVEEKTYHRDQREKCIMKANIAVLHDYIRQQTNKQKIVEHKKEKKNYRTQKKCSSTT